jgi:hypothetical protein
MASLDERLSVVENELVRVVTHCEDLATVVNHRVFKSELAQCMKALPQCHHLVIDDRVAAIEQQATAAKTELDNTKTKVEQLLDTLPALMTRIDTLSAGFKEMMERVDSVILLHATTTATNATTTLKKLDNDKAKVEQHGEMQIEHEHGKARAEVVEEVNVVPEHPCTPEQSNIPTPALTEPDSVAEQHDFHSEEATQMNLNHSVPIESVQQLIQLAHSLDEETLWETISFDVVNVDVAYMFSGRRLGEIVRDLMSALKVDACEENALFNYIRTSIHYNTSEDVYWVAFFLSIVAKSHMEEITKTETKAKIEHFEHLAIHADAPVSPRKPLTPRTPRTPKSKPSSPKTSRPVSPKSPKSPTTNYNQGLSRSSPVPVKQELV